MVKRNPNVQLSFDLLGISTGVESLDRYTVPVDGVMSSVERLLQQPYTAHSAFFDRQDLIGPIVYEHLPRPRLSALS